MKVKSRINFNACNSEMCYRAPLSFRPNKWSPHIFHQNNYRNFITDTCRCFITADRLKCFHSIFPDTKSCRCCINWKIINLFLQTQFSDLIFPDASLTKFLTWFSHPQKILELIIPDTLGTCWCFITADRLKNLCLIFQIK